MKLSDMPTPETDACAKRCRDNLPFALASQNPIESIGDVVTVAHARMLEQRLGLMVAALKECYSDENAERRKGERRVKWEWAERDIRLNGNRTGTDRRQAK